MFAVVLVQVAYTTALERKKEESERCKHHFADATSITNYVIKTKMTTTTIVIFIVTIIRKLHLRILLLPKVSLG